MSESHFGHLLFPDSVVTHVRAAAATLQHYYGHYRLAIRDALPRSSRKPFQCGGLRGYDQLVAIEHHLQQQCLHNEPDPYLFFLHDQVQRAVTTTATQAEQVRQSRWLRRLHRDPVRALTQVDQQFYQVVNAHTRASGDAFQDSR